MAGLSYDRQSLDNRMGSLVLALRDTFEAVVTLNDQLQNDTRFANATLTAATTSGGYGYTQAEVDSFKAAFLALNDLNSIAWGHTANANPNNYFFEAVKLTGVM